MVVLILHECNQDGLYKLNNVINEISNERILLSTTNAEQKSVVSKVEHQKSFQTDYEQQENFLPTT